MYKRQKYKQARFYMGNSGGSRHFLSQLARNPITRSAGCKEVVAAFIVSVGKLSHTIV